MDRTERRFLIDVFGTALLFWVLLNVASEAWFYFGIPVWLGRLIVLVMLGVLAWYYWSLSKKWSAYRRRRPGET